jgi:hypothetical protein
MPITLSVAKFVRAAFHRRSHGPPISRRSPGRHPGHGIDNFSRADIGATSARRHRHEGAVVGQPDSLRGQLDPGGPGRVTEPFVDFGRSSRPRSLAFTLTAEEIRPARPRGGAGTLARFTFAQHREMA